MCVNRVTKYVMLRHFHSMYGVVCMALHDYTQTHTPKGTCYEHHQNHQQHNAASTQQEYATHIYFGNKILLRFPCKQDTEGI